MDKKLTCKIADFGLSTKKILTIPNLQIRLNASSSSAIKLNRSGTSLSDSNPSESNSNITFMENHGILILFYFILFYFF